MTTPTPEQIAAMIDALRNPPRTLAADLAAMIDAERRCGTAIPDGFAGGGAGGRSPGAVARPTESAVAARATASDEHTALTRQALEAISHAACRVSLVIWAVDGEHVTARHGDIAGLVALIASVPRKSPVGCPHAHIAVPALSQAARHLSVAISAVARARGLSGPRRDPERCDTVGCDGSAARDAGGRGGRCRTCVDWDASHRDPGDPRAWPTAPVLAALGRGDRVAAARLWRDRARTS